MAVCSVPDAERTQRRSLGITDLDDPIPHPDQVKIDIREGTARIVGHIRIGEEPAGKIGKALDELR